MRSHRVALIALALLPPVPMLAQGTLEEAAGRARQLWLAHDVAALVAGSDTVRLQLPGVTYFAALAPGQAARLLDRYLEATTEIGLELRGVRAAGPEQGYAEGRRRYAVQGTSEEREEMVYLEFRLVGGKWRLREVRIVP
jgi:hypothetical protein